MSRAATQVAIPRVKLESDHDTSSLIAVTVMEQLDELIPRRGDIDLSTLGVGGRWDPLLDAFLISTWIQEGK